MLFWNFVPRLNSLISFFGGFHHPQSFVDCILWPSKPPHFLHGLRIYESIETMNTNLFPVILHQVQHWRNLYGRIAPLCPGPSSAIPNLNYWCGHQVEMWHLIIRKSLKNECRGVCSLGRPFDPWTQDSFPCGFSPGLYLRVWSTPSLISNDSPRGGFPSVLFLPDHTIT